MRERGTVQVAYGDGVIERITAAAAATPAAAFIDLVGGGYVELALELGVCHGPDTTGSTTFSAMTSTASRAGRRGLQRARRPWPIWPRPRRASSWWRIQVRCSATFERRTGLDAGRHGRGRSSSSPDGPNNHHHPVRTAHLGRGEPAANATGPAGSGRGRSQMKLVVNGADVEVDDRHAKTPLLWVLRDVLGCAERSSAAGPVSARRARS